MEERLNSLEQKQTALLEKASKDDFAFWLSNPITKALIVQCQIDSEEIKDMWTQGNFPTNEDQFYRGQAAYAENFPVTMRELKASD